MRPIVTLLYASVVVGFTTTSVGAAVVVPTGLSPGDTYQLAFITDGKRDAASTSIADYNTFVTTEAALAPGLTGTSEGVEWFAIASTADDDARDNAVVSAPVYLLDGTTKIADSFTDMWDGSIDNQFILTQYGTITSDFFPWTGSLSDGTQFSSPLGASIPLSGRAPLTNTGWMVWNSETQTTELPLYALSEVLTVPSVIPEPSAFVLVALSMLGLYFCNRSRRTQPKTDDRL